MKCGALSVLGLAGERALEAVLFAPDIAMPSRLSDPSTGGDLSVIGLYGSWAASLNCGRLPSFSFRNKRFDDVAAWRESARKCVMERMAIPAIGSTPKITIKRSMFMTEYASRSSHGSYHTDDRPKHAFLDH